VGICTQKEKNMRNTPYDFLIIGAGPAGLQLAYFLAQRQHDYLVLAATDHAGAFFGHYPRHRKLISINKVHTGTEDEDVNLRFDWNSLLCDDERLRFRHYSQDYFPDPVTLHHHLADFAARYQLNIRYNTRVVNIACQGELFRVRDTHGQQCMGRRLIVATGLWTPYIPDIPGAELCENYTTCSVDPQDFVNQRVLIVGKGNSAFETAENLTGTAATIHLCSPHAVTLAWQTHFVGNVRAINSHFIDTYQCAGSLLCRHADAGVRLQADDVRVYP
jgi:cation diffusion facilitator CzcD-associated flavoprotein CzcO